MNPYLVLKVAENCNLEDIKKSYRALSKVFHPDNGGDDTTFNIINEAYEILKDPERRKMYDETGSTDPKIDVVRMATESISNAFNALMGKQDPENLLRRDIINDINQAFHTVINKMEGSVPAAQRKIKGYEKILKRIKCKGDHDVMSSILNKRIQTCKKEVEQTLLEKQIYEKAIEMLKNYKFDYDKGPENSLLHATTSNIGSGFNSIFGRGR